MKKINSIITNFILITLCAALGCVSVSAQYAVSEAVGSTVAEETRPFDFSDKVYDANGVQPDLIAGRATGADERSVFTKNENDEYRDVRFVQTLPAYNFDGSTLFYNYYGDLLDTGFTADANGRHALEVAHSFPLFVFPSVFEKGSRQTDLLDARDGYFTKNPLGLSVVIEVRYTELIEKEEGAQIIKELGDRNGYTVDGTPIIKTVAEINYLTRIGLVTQKVRGSDQKGVPSYAIVKAIDISKAGAIAPDAFLVPVTKQDGQPLEAERQFIENFNCLQKTGEACTK